MNNEIELRVKTILEALTPICNEISDQIDGIQQHENKENKITKQANEVFSLKLTQSNFRLKSAFATACKDFKKVGYDAFKLLTVDMISELVSAFKWLISEIISLGVIIVPSKQMFGSFSGLTVSQIDFLSQIDNDEIKAEIEDLISYIYDMTIESAAIGIRKERGTMNRIKSKVQGLAVEEVGKPIVQYVDKQVNVHEEHKALYTSSQELLESICGKRKQLPKGKK
jgi:hypothetical protein